MIHLHWHLPCPAPLCALIPALLALHPTACASEVLGVMADATLGHSDGSNAGSKCSTVSMMQAGKAQQQAYVDPYAADVYATQKQKWVLKQQREALL